MLKARSIRLILYGLLSAGVLAVVAFGILTAIGQEGPGPVSDQEKQQLQATADSYDLLALADFAQSHGNPCDLDAAESSVDLFNRYRDLPSLVNDVDVVIVGEMGPSTSELPKPGTLASDVLTAVHVGDVLKGTVVGTDVQVDTGARVMRQAGASVRVSLAEIDPCSTGEAVLFLQRTAEASVYTLNLQGWASISAGRIKETPADGVLDAYSDSADLERTVSQLANNAEAQGLPRGRLVCESQRDSPDRIDPLVCPGDSFNPVQTFGLDGGVAQILVVVTDPGPSSLAISQETLASADSRSDAILLSLNLVAELVPSDQTPDDTIRVTLSLEHRLGERGTVQLDYSPSTGLIQIPQSGGQFEAPASFREAMQEFVARQTTAD